MRPPTPEWKLEAFDWLPVDHWNPTTILNDYSVNGKRYCKICDGVVLPKSETKHVKFHVKERNDLAQRVKEENAEIARLKRELDKIERKKIREVAKVNKMKEDK